MTDADGSETTTDGGGDDGRRLITRRRLLAAGGGLVGLGGGGALYVYSELQGDDGDYVAPASFPTLSTRGAFDSDGNAQFDGDHPTPERNGEGPSNDGDPIVLFVHGFSTEHEAARDQAYTAEVGLSETTSPHPVLVYSWDSDREWAVAKSIAEANGRALASWLTERSGPPLHIVAHSLGARVTCEALRSFEDTSETAAIASVSLLGGAIPRESVERGGRYSEAIQTAVPTVANYYSNGDRVLGWIYRLSNGNRAVGATGIADEDAAPDGYVDVDVSASVGDHYSYYEPGEGCLPAVVERFP